MNLNISLRDIYLYSPILTNYKSTQTIYIEKFHRTTPRNDSKNNTQFYPIIYNEITINNYNNNLYE